MITNWRRCGLTVAVASILAAPFTAAQSQTDTAAVRAFVRDFYTWYHPRSRQRGPEWPPMAVLRERPQSLTVPFRRALNDEVAAAGLYEYSLRFTDDPFLYQGSFCKGFDVGPADAAGPLFRVQVSAVCHGPQYDSLSTVTVQVVRAEGRWQIADVQSHGGETVLGAIHKFVDRRRASGRRPVCLAPDSVMPIQRTFQMADRCMTMWIDSILSPLEERADIAVSLASIVGGRRAVDALRANAPRSRSLYARWASIYALGTTGSTEDRAFLRAIVADTSSKVEWSQVQQAVIVLTFLRDTASIPFLQGAADRRPNRADGQWARRAMDAIKRPACADTVSGVLARELLRIVMQCRDNFLHQPDAKQRRYLDESNGEVWLVSDSTVTRRASTPADSVAPRLTSSLSIAEGPGVALVQVGMHCGSLCGEGWTYRLQREGKRWRVVLGTFDWIS